MTAISEVECWTMLGIHPKTLRNWLRQAHLHFVAHPTDARLKCLTPEQVQQLAALHARPLPSPAAASPALRQEAPLLPSALSPPSSPQPNEAQVTDAPASCSEEAGLRTAVSGLEAKVMALQEQLAQLTLELLRERSERYERRLSSLEALLSQGASLLPVKAEEGRSLLPKASAPSSDLSSQASCGHVLASSHGWKWGRLGPMCSSSHTTGTWLSPPIRCNGVSVSALSPRSALSATPGVLRPIERDSAAGEPIALFMVRTTNSLSAPPIVSPLLAWKKSLACCNLA